MFTIWASTLFTPAASSEVTCIFKHIAFILKNIDRHIYSRLF